MPTPHFITIALTFKVILHNITSYYRSINSSNKNIVLIENVTIKKSDMYSASTKVQLNNCGCFHEQYFHFLLFLLLFFIKNIANML